MIQYSRKKIKIRNNDYKNTDTVTEEIAGIDKDISDTPMTLHVKMTGSPNLTMVDLPRITRGPVEATRYL